MKTPEQKYSNDPEYNRFVDMVESFLEHAQFTPSEVREMCMLACIHHEYRKPKPRLVHPELEKALATMEYFRTGHKR